MSWRTVLAFVFTIRVLSKRPHPAKVRGRLLRLGGRCHVSARSDPHGMCSDDSGGALSGEVAPSFGRAAEAACIKPCFKVGGRVSHRSAHPQKRGAIPSYSPILEGSAAEAEEACSLTVIE
jgi:hypothetical protein